jgi:hypothetical protein
LSFPTTASDQDENAIDDQEDLIDLQDTMVLLNEHVSPSLNSLIYDVLFRPLELENISMWDQFALYEKKKIRKGKQRVEDSDTEADDNGIFVN